LRKLTFANEAANLKNRLTGAEINMDYPEEGIE